MITRKTFTDDLIQKNLTEHYQKYYRLVYSYVRNEADAMDIVQEGACRAIQKSGTLQNAKYLDTWLYRIMVNEAINFLRQNRWDITSLEEDTKSCEDTYTNIDLSRAVDHLEEPDRTIIHLRYYEDMKLEQVAEIVGENINTVKSRLYRTLKRLRLSLE